jgi:hypothetical protein
VRRVGAGQATPPLHLYDQQQQPVAKPQPAGAAATRAHPAGAGRAGGAGRVRLGQNYLNGSIPGGLLYLPAAEPAGALINLLTGIPDV